MRILLSFFFILCLSPYLLIEIPITFINDETNLSNQHNILGRRLEAKQVPMTKKSRMFTIEAYLGTPPQLVKLKLSSLFQGVILADDSQKDLNGFNSQTSTSYKEIDFLTNSFGSGPISTDNFSFSGLDPIPNFPFFFVHRPKFTYNSNYIGLLGLAYNLEEKYDSSRKAMFNLFDYFINAEGRNRQLIGFKTDNKENGIMYIGDFPSEIMNNKKKYKTCSITTPERNHSWQCNLNAIYFDDNQLIPVNKPVSFILGGNILGVNKEVYWNIKDKFFTKAIQDGQCYLDRDDDPFIQLICKKDFDTSSLGLLSLVLGKWTLKIEIKHMFYEAQGMLYFAIVSKEPDLDAWYISPSMIFGTYIFLDKENKEIGFYDSVLVTDK